MAQCSKKNVRRKHLLICKECGATFEKVCEDYIVENGWDCPSVSLCNGECEVIATDEFIEIFDEREYD